MLDVSPRIWTHDLPIPLEGGDIEFVDGEWRRVPDPVAPPEADVPSPAPDLRQLTLL